MTALAPSDDLMSESGLPVSQYPLGKDRDGAWLVALWLVVTACNLFKPYHIDDTAHLIIAQWIAAHPLHPMSGLLNWNGIDEPIHRTNQPHLYFYALAAWQSLFGLSEPAMHAFQALPALACILLFHRMGRALIPDHALWLTAILVLGPAFLVEQNLMVDVPLLAVWLGFFTMLTVPPAGMRRTSSDILAASLCAVAILIKYSSLVLLPIFVITLLFGRGRSRMWMVAIPLLVVCAWALFNLWDYGGIHMLGRSPGDSIARFGIPLVFADWIITLGAIVPIGMIFPVTRLWKDSSGIAYLGLGAAFLLLVAGAASNLVPPSTADNILRTAFVCNGLLIAFALAGPILRSARQSWASGMDVPLRAEMVLSIWIVATTAFYVLVSPFIAARHVLLILPAVLIIGAQRLGPRLSARGRAFALALTIVISGGLAISDWRFAGFYKQEATLLAALPQGERPNWAWGHWGWQWYAQQQGLRQIDVKSSLLRPGDLVASAREVAREPIASADRWVLVRTDTQSRPLLDLFCTGRPSGLYESDLLTLPWSLSLSCQHHMDILRVTAPRQGDARRPGFGPAPDVIFY